MKNIVTKISLAALLIFPVVAFGQGFIDGEAGGFGTFTQGIILFINNFLIPLMIALCVLGFIWGVFQYFILGSDDEEKRGQGRSLMLYAIIGFVAIVALWGIVEFVAGGFGFEVGRDALPAPGVGFGG